MYRNELQAGVRNSLVREGEAGRSWEKRNDATARLGTYTERVEGSEVPLGRGLLGVLWALQCDLVVSAAPASCSLTEQGWGGGVVFLDTQPAPGAQLLA